MSDVLLINYPFRARGIPTIFPIQLATLGSNLIAHGHNVRVLDLNVCPETDLHDLLENRRFDFVGISYRNASPAFWLERFRGLRRFIIRLQQCGIEPLVGGPGLSLFAEKIFEWVPEIEWGAIGEGEQTLLRFVEGDDPATIPGLCYRKSGALHVNYPPAFLKGADLPEIQDLEGLEYKHSNYLIGLQTYRGCEQDCAYCPVNYLGGAGLRLRDLDSVRRDLEFFKARAVNHLFVIDGIFHQPLERSERLLDLFNSVGFPVTWEGFFRPWNGVDEKYIRLTAAAGAVRYHVDVITGSSRLNTNLGHGVEPERAVEFATLLKKCGIEGVFYFSYQLPGETFRDSRATQSVIRRIRREDQRTYIFPFFPYPETRLEEIYGKILHKSLGWHAWRLIRMIFRPTFFKFILNLISLDKSTGPPDDGERQA